ncbi:DUF742 domain-containing protein [Streptomyces sp. NPDC092296]|uniref:DUF742 domain-containing protein n=1 Tax=Streptomyces sp. NPDC092296 TaxID=3366012 RepID=UPI0037F76B77
MTARSRGRPLVPPYAALAGTSSAKGVRLDHVALLRVISAAPPELPAGQWAVMDVLADGPLTVAETAAALALPIAVLRELAGALVAAGLVTYANPTAAPPDLSLLQKVADGLRALKG